MDLQTLEKGNELLAKYRLCEKMLEYLSDPDAVTGQAYKEKCGDFFKVFHDEMLVVTHDLMVKCGEEFNELHCEEHSEQPDVPAPPSEEKEPKFAIGSKVEIVDGKYKGRIGTVKDFNGTDGYYVMSDFNQNGSQFSMWFPELDLKAYVEESEEQPETPTPPEDEDDKYEMVYGERVIVKSGEYAGKVGTIIDVMVGFTKVLVGLDDVEDAVEFTPDQLAKYTDPENTEDNGGTVTTDTGE